MSLTTDLANLAQSNRARFPEAVNTTMAQATADLADSAIIDHSVKVGNSLPKIVLPNAKGQTVDVQALLNQGPVVIAFYRGGWCPYCNLELRALQQALPDIQAQGATLVAISPETPDNSLSTQEKNALEFEVLSDQGNQVARQMGLVFTLPESLRPIYENFGIDVPAANGDQSFELPLPATYVVNTNGTIVHAFVNVDYTQREDPDVIIAALKKQPAKV